MIKYKIKYKYIRGSKWVISIVETVRKNIEMAQSYFKVETGSKINKGNVCLRKYE